ncbi:MAG: GNAT family N-acetyltransferase [Pseudomonadales bacterium]|nr:GNAT family N-acetyltransferase [Pseudomonadales bacterium]
MKTKHFQLNDDIVLRTYQLTDAPELIALIDINREYLREWLPWLDQNYQVEDSEKFIQFTLDQLAQDLGFICGIYFEGKLVGSCGYHMIDKSNASVSLGYWLAEDKTGKGIVTRCVKFFIDYAFDHLNLNKVVIQVGEKNVASRAICERLSLVNEGLERDAENLYGEYVNHIRYSVLKSEWAG